MLDVCILMLDVFDSIRNNGTGMPPRAKALAVLLATARQVTVSNNNNDSSTNNNAPLVETRMEEIGYVDPDTMDSWLEDAKAIGFSVHQGWTRQCCWEQQHSCSL